MNVIRYKCNNCQHDWDGNDFTTECPLCNSGNIEKSKKSSAVSSKWVLVGVTIIALLGVTGLLIKELGLGLNGGSSPVPIENNSQEDIIEAARDEYKVKIVERSGWFYLRLEKFDGLKYLEIDPKRVSRIVNMSTGKVIMHEKGKLLLCSRDEGEYVGLRIYFTDNKVSRVLKTTTRLSLFGKTPSNSANCGSPLRSHHIRIYRNIQKCTDYIDLEQSTGVDKTDVDISVSGKNGSYQKRWVWKVDENNGDKYNVWIAHEGDTIPAFENGDKKVRPCNSQTDVEGVLVKVETAAFSFGKDPTNSKRRSELKDLLRSFGASPVCYLNGNKLNGFSQLAIDMKDIYKNSDGAVQFTLRSKPKLLSDNKTIQIEYSSK